MSIADIFDDAQKSGINHRSLTKRLHKLEAKYEAQNKHSDFEEEIKDYVLRCLEVTKSERAGQNIVKFVCTYCAFEQSQISEKEEQDGDDEEDTNSVTSQILIMLLPHTAAKDKVLRYRATQIVSQLMGIVQEIEDELYQAIRHELTKRIRDKVPAIRLEAVCALGRLLENEMDQEAQAAQEKSRNSEDEEMLDDDDYEELESASLLDKLLDVLQNDTNADVRKALLLNLPIEPKTLPYLLERARDKDAAVRRVMYAKLMPNLGDFRHLSMSMREKLLRWGLRDRDERVRKAAAKMFSTLWIEQVAKTNAQTETQINEGIVPSIEGGEPQQPKKKHIGFYNADIPALLELLERVDVINCGQEDGAGQEAMSEFWNLRPDYVQAVVIDDTFLAELSPESAFMARTFYDFCARNPEQHLIALEENKLPEVTRFGFHLQTCLNNVLNMQALSEDEVEEEAIQEAEFICEQLLHIAHTLDYTDEIGRRKMFESLRRVIAMHDLPEEITKLAIEALRLTCTSDIAGEKEFIAVVQEAIAEVQDVLTEDKSSSTNEDNGTNREHSPADDESFVSAQSELSTRSDATARPVETQAELRTKNMTPEEAEAYHLKEVLIQLKCLNIAHTLLQNITSDFSSNISLDTMINTLIIPALHNQQAALRERAIECLGLACLLSPALERANRSVFVYCMRKGHDELRISCLKILCDCITTHHTKSTDTDNGQAAEQVDLSPFVKAFGYSAEVQTVATTCVAKLMMCGFYKPKIAPVEANQEDEEEEGGEKVVDVFEQAIEAATEAGTKGYELLTKVKAALVADARGKEQIEEPRRQS
ncbi:chromosome condensation complex Condensin, subunit G [Lithohypha guttulata]|uniref:Chromosome condensation complex Condensin, subunit G n=1 Tax=Lithohypha guttulata TaxID=1690604 RepID=A0AAN7T375_9EURO|nr:chromosome condensation complex Condensin, subunit G [Lithohypha guttulata]